jgi:dTDP-4-dehydrorhamnose reductase
VITLIGHGYIGEHIAKELSSQNLQYQWINHTDVVPNGTTVIINAAGYTGSPNVDACEIHKQETIDGNVLWPLRLENQFPDTPIIHISSGCIYTGYTFEGWTEEDKPNFDFSNGSFYSGSKALGQEVLMPFLKSKSYLLRIRMPFGDEDHPKNFLTKMKTYKKLISYDNSLSYVPDVARVAVHFATTRPTPGIYNVCNPGYSNAREITQMMDINKEWFTEEEFKKATVAPRSNCILSTIKLQSIFPIQRVDTALRKAIK